METQSTKKFPQYLAGLAAAVGAMAIGAALGNSINSVIVLVYR